MTEAQVRAELERTIREKGSASAIGLWLERYAPLTEGKDARSDEGAAPAALDELARRRAG